MFHSIVTLFLVSCAFNKLEKPKFNLNKEQADILRDVKILYQNHFQTEAMEYLLQATEKKFYFNPEIRIKLAESFFVNQKKEMAFTELNKLKKLNPNHLDIYEAEADLYIQDKNFSKSIQAYSNYISHDNTNLRIYYKRALAFYHSSRFAEALPDLKLLHDINPFNRDVVMLYAIVLNKQKSSNSYKLIDQFLKQYPQDSQILELKGDLLVKDNRELEAKPYYLQAVAIQPQNINVGTKLGRTHLNLKEIDNAKKQLLRVLEIDKNFEPAQYFYVKAYLNEGDFAQAGSTLEKYYKKNPKRWVVLGLAKLYQSLDDHQKAEELLVEHLKNHDDLELSLILAKGYMAQEKFNKVLDLLERYKGKSNNKKLYFYLTAAYRGVGRKQNANEASDFIKKLGTQKITNQDVETPRLDSFSSVIVEKGDTLQTISSKLFGTTKRWELIYDLNRDQLKTPHDLTLGMKLKIPDIENIRNQ